MFAILESRPQPSTRTHQLAIPLSLNTEKFERSGSIISNGSVEKINNYKVTHEVVGMGTDMHGWVAVAFSLEFECVETPWQKVGPFTRDL